MVDSVRRTLAHGSGRTPRCPRRVLHKTRRWRPGERHDVCCTCRGSSDGALHIRVALVASLHRGGLVIAAREWGAQGFGTERHRTARVELLLVDLQPFEPVYGDKQIRREVVAPGESVADEGYGGRVEPERAEDRGVS